MDHQINRDAVVLGLVIMAIVVAVGLIAVFASAPVPYPKEPKFTANQCFNRNGLREPWESNGPDGLIVQRGYKQYLVLFRDEAERRSAGTKVGVPVSIGWFDQEHYVIDCPQSWTSHGRER